MSLIFFIQGEAVHGLRSTEPHKQWGTPPDRFWAGVFYRLLEEAIWTQNDWLGGQESDQKVSGSYSLLAKAELETCDWYT